MEIALSARSKLGFIRGDYPKPSDPDLLIKWQRCHDVVMSWLISSVSKKIVSRILHAKDVVSAWNSLHTRYAGSNISREYAIRKNITNMVQGDLDVTDYFENLSRLWEELDAVREKRVCMNEDTCVGCYEGVKEREKNRVIEFLMGLGEVHNQIRTYILTLPQLPNIDSAFDMVSQDESQRTVTRNPCADVSALYVSQSDRNSVVKSSGKITQDKDKNQLFCTNCECTGHTKDRCYKLIGYPPGYKNRGRGSGNGGRRGGGRGAVHNVASSESGMDERQAASKNDSGMQLTSAQIAQLLALLKQDNGSAQNSSGTHMADLSNFEIMSKGM